MTFKASDFEGIESKVTWIRFRHGTYDEMIVRGDNVEVLLDLSDNIKWEQIGQSIGRSTVLRELAFEFPDDMPPQWASSIETFFNAVKHNTYLERLKMDFSPRNGFPDFDLEYFVANNTQLKSLSISSRLPLLSDQGRMIASSIGTSSSLKQLYIRFAEFEHAYSFRQIVSACSDIEELFCECNHIDKCNAIADLLRNPAAKLKGLDIYMDRKIAERGMAVIAEDEWKKSLGRALCDSSSIESIQNSNHTLESIAYGLFGDETCPSEFVQDCLKLNEHEDKEQVIRQKIAKYYFVGGYDVSPFAAMPLSAMPKVISTIGGDANNQCSAIFRMLKTNFRMLKTIFRMLKTNFRMLKTIFRMLKTIPEYVNKRGQQTDN
eukprot:scaffold53430_cov60-Cyclotella_meneghiniana.AAC.6